MERLIEVVQELSHARSLEQVMAIVRSAARELTGADGATFVLRDRDLCYYADEDAIEPLWKGKRFPMSACISGWAMLNRAPAAIPDIYADPRVPVDAYRPTFVKSLVMVPIRTEEPIGAIGSYWAVQHRATPEELRLLQALAHSTSVALENAELYGALERRVAERTRELHAANAELLAANQSLSELQRHKEELAALLVHDLRSPAATIVMRAQLRLGDRSLSERERRSWIHELAAGEAIGRMATNLLDVARADTATLPVNRAPLDLAELAREAVSLMSASAEGREQTIALELPDGPVELSADRELLRRVLQNLIDNGLRYSPAGSELRVAVTRDAAGVEIAVRDCGKGIPAQLREHVFERYVRLAGSGAEETGRGLGLAFSRLAVEGHGGRIWVEANQPQGSCFRIRLPR
ncbi:MAG TPA: ATP-binding protein [Myxococcota bacterium]|nr:ATP-binding protein [Myxococcota bacterium]